MKVGIIGSGDVARSLGSGFIQLGHSVKLGTRDPKAEKLRDWVSKGGALASTGSFEEVARFGELLVLAVKGDVAEEALQLAGIANFAGKTLIDVTNPLAFSEGGAPHLFVGFSDSLGERVQRLVPDAHVVKAFNTVGNAHFFRPEFPGGPPDMFICGNDAGAKTEVGDVLQAFGWTVVDVGGIDGARTLEPICILWVNSALRLGTWDLALKFLRKGMPSPPAGRP
jgi:predicted dinucleotide-binding enzyme